MRLRRAQFETSNHEVFLIINEEDWMVSICKPGKNGPGFLVPSKERPNIANCGHAPSGALVRDMLTPFAEKLAQRVSEMFELRWGEMEMLRDELLDILPNLLRADQLSPSLNRGERHAM